MDTTGTFTGTGVSPPPSQYQHFASEGVNIFRIRESSYVPVFIVVMSQPLLQLSVRLFAQGTKSSNLMISTSAWQLMTPTLVRERLRSLNNKLLIRSKPGRNHQSDVPQYLRYHCASCSVFVHQAIRDYRSGSCDLQAG